jgi:pimeloyl-ACP methyl ester carboxylesterase
VPGRLVDVGGYKLHINCMGQGSPTVILDHMGDGSSAEWGWVQPEIAKGTRVCAYDRAGFGWSDAGDAIRQVLQSARSGHPLSVSASSSWPTARRRPCWPGGRAWASSPCVTG